MTSGPVLSPAGDLPASAGDRALRPERVSGAGAKLEVRYVYPGQVSASATPCAVSTVLGTCVSVCLWDAHAGVGGMNHYLLPYPVAKKDASPRFGKVAIPALLEKVLALGATRGHLQAKVFGGMASRYAAEACAKDLGAANVSLALELLGEERVPIVARDVGGTRGRKLVFHLDDGSAWVRQL